MHYNYYSLLLLLFIVLLFVWKKEKYSLGLFKKIIIVTSLGYFTSRPGLKGYVRQCNKHLQVCKQLEAINNGITNKKMSSDTLS